MMCDTTNRSFRTRLAAILDKITKAALVEIGNLADECSAVLHTEMSLHKTENEALKKRCYSLEVQLRAAREAQTFPAHVINNRRQHAGQEDSFDGLERAVVCVLAAYSYLTHKSVNRPSLKCIKSFLHSVFNNKKN